MKVRFYDPLYHCTISPAFKVNQYESGQTYAKIIYPSTKVPLKDKSYQDNYPVLFFIQDEGIDATSLDQEVAQLSTIARFGYCVVILSYRDVNYGVLPLQIHDCMDSIYSLLSQRYGAYPLDTSNYFISGNGFGGYLAIQSALHLFSKYNTLDSNALKGVIDFYGPMDFDVNAMDQSYMRYIDLSDTEDDIVDGSSVYDSLCQSTIRFPLFIVHGTNDVCVPVEQAQQLEKIALANCFDVVYLEIENGNHGGELVFSDNMLHKVQDYMNRKIHPEVDSYRY